MRLLKTIQIFTTIIITALLFSCRPKTEDSLVLLNNSDHTISVSESVPWSDTLVNSIHFNLRDEIRHNQSKTFDRGMNVNTPTWRFHIRDSKDKKLKIWIFNSDTLKKYKGKLTINEIVGKKLFDTVLIYNEKQLDDLKYHIIYSGRQIQ